MPLRQGPQNMGVRPLQPAGGQLKEEMDARQKAAAALAKKRAASAPAKAATPPQKKAKAEENAPKLSAEVAPGIKRITFDLSKASEEGTTLKVLRNGAEVPKKSQQVQKEEEKKGAKQQQTPQVGKAAAPVQGSPARRVQRIVTTAVRNAVQSSSEEGKAGATPAQRPATAKKNEKGTPGKEAKKKAPAAHAVATTST